MTIMNLKHAGLTDNLAQRLYDLAYRYRRAPFEVDITYLGAHSYDIAARLDGYYLEPQVVTHPAQLEPTIEKILKETTYSDISKD